MWERVKEYLILILLIILVGLTGMFLIEREKTTQTGIKWTNPEKMLKKNIKTVVVYKYINGSVVEKTETTTDTSTETTHVVEGYKSKTWGLWGQYNPITTDYMAGAGIIILDSVFIGAGANHKLEWCIHASVLF